MQHINILKGGLSIISQCKKETEDIWHAHFGAAAIASYFFTKGNNLDENTVLSIHSQTKMMLNKHMLGETKDIIHGIDFQKAEEIIITSLEKTIDELHWVGHNVIYASLSLLAIYELRNWGTKQDIEDIADLILSFEKAIPGRSWIGFSTREVKQLDMSDNEMVTFIKTPEQLSKFILEELSRFHVIYRAEAHHDLIGHMLTFSHAVNILYDLGHVNLFKRSLTPLLKLVHVLKDSQNFIICDTLKLSSPVDRLPLIKAQRAKVLPIENAFWLKNHSELNWDFGHQFKFSYSYFDHVKRAPEYKDETLEKFRDIINY
ncbi:hypothetical protein D0U04_07655 [Bacillus clarus]|uniref:Uncharacterized protein n=1 Tax=Bacillus clarus TaxID=2338372 RepID=A0A090YQC3_9BACI|nr:hypothetical protein [Bacillus clarus]KFN01024.1 hypothetical protein DJ93_4869 [Bacillus clarus]RFT67634.1 hypothetical protein D0U04_07655 [Bacillus clarus]